MPVNVVSVVLVALFSLSVGSFLGLASYRLPRGESLMGPRSRCPQCGCQLGASELVPLFSFLLRRGRCLECRAPIGWRYPLIEILSVALFLVVYLDVSSPWALVGGWILAAVLMVATVTDIEGTIIPNRLTYPAIAAGLVWAALHPGIGVAGGLLGTLAAGGVLLLLGLLVPGSMGGGDVKLAAAFGAFLGWPYAFLAVFLGFLLGGLAGVVLIALGRKSRKDMMVFGPCLAAAAMAVYLFGPEILGYYLSLIGV